MSTEISKEMNPSRDDFAICAGEPIEEKLDLRIHDDWIRLGHDRGVRHRAAVGVCCRPPVVDQLVPGLGDRTAGTGRRYVAFPQRARRQITGRNRSRRRDRAIRGEPIVRGEAGGNDLSGAGYNARRADQDRKSEGCHEDTARVRH